jgi:hypothetical protein
MTALKSAAYALQVAVKERIQAAIPTWTISEKTPKNKKPPYIELYDVQVTQTIPSSSAPTIEKLRFTIRVFDDSENSEKIKDAIDDIRAAITDTPIVLGGGFYSYNQIHERTIPSQLQRDKKTWMGQTIFLFSVRQAS